MLMGLEHNLVNTTDPHACAEVGKECRSCVRQRASVVALLCPGLDAVGAQQMFFRMYREAACAGMARTFVREYLSSVEPEEIAAPVGGPYYQIAACA